LAFEIENSKLKIEIEVETPRDASGDLNPAVCGYLRPLAALNSPRPALTAHGTNFKIF
jgi:hypothetical protein